MEGNREKLTEMSKPQSSCVHIFVYIKRLNKLADIMQIKFSHFTLHIILAISSSAAALLMVHIRESIVTKNECAHLRCSFADIRHFRARNWFSKFSFQWVFSRGSHIFLCTFSDF